MKYMTSSILLVDILTPPTLHHLDEYVSICCVLSFQLQINTTGQRIPEVST